MKKIDPILYLLTGLVLLYTGVIIFVAIWLKNDGQTFQIVSNLASGFAGSLLTRINPTRPNTDAVDASIKKITDVHTESQSPLTAEKKD
jgi:hypothetical protein